MHGDIFMVGRKLKKTVALFFLATASLLLNYTTMSSLSTGLSLLYLGAGAVGAWFGIKNALNEGRSFGGVLLQGVVGYGVGVASIALGGSIFNPN
jgi:hypothetical protein